MNKLRKLFLAVFIITMFVPGVMAHRSDRNPQVAGGMAPGPHTHPVSELSDFAVTDPITLSGGNTVGFNTVWDGTLNSLIISSATASRPVAFDNLKQLISTTFATWIAGTANQVIVTDDGDGSVTLSTPQDIHSAASPTFVGVTLSGLTVSRLMASSGAKALVSVADLTNWIAGTVSEIIVTDDTDGTITLSLDPAVGGGVFREVATENIWGPASAGNDGHTNAEYNFATIDGAGSSLTIGDDNVFIGRDAGKDATGTNDSVAIGPLAGENWTSMPNSIAIGAEAIQGDVGGASGAGGNIGIGPDTLKAITTGNNNTAIGSDALQDLTNGTLNIGIGNGAITNITTGDHNIGLGNNVMFDVTSSSNNIALGQTALQNVTTGDNNIAIGNNAGANLTGNSENNLAIRGGPATPAEYQQRGWIDSHSTDTPLLGFDFSSHTVTVTGTLGATTLITGPNVTSNADPGHTHTGASLGTIDISDDTNLAGGDALTLNDDTMDFDGGAAPAGDLGGTWATPSVDNDSHDHTGATLSGIDISDDTNLTAGDALTLTDDDIDFDGGATPSGDLGGTWVTPSVDNDSHDHTSATLTLTLDEVGNLAANKTFNNAANSVSFNFTNPSGSPTYDGAYEIQASGAFVGDLFHVHQHTGNPGTTDLVHLEAEDDDVLQFRVSHSGNDAIKQLVVWQLDRASTSDDDEVYHSFLFDQDGTVTSQSELEFGRFGLTALDVSEDTEDAEFTFDAIVNGSLTEVLSAGSAGLDIPDSSIIKGEEKYIEFTLADPNGLQGAIDEWGIKLDISDAITISRVQVWLNGVANELTGDLVYVDNIALDNPVIINDFDTTSGERDDSTIATAAVPAGKRIIINFGGDVPNAAILWAVFKITYTID